MSALDSGPIRWLVEDVLLQIFQHLDGRDLLCCEAVSSMATGNAEWDTLEKVVEPTECIARIASILAKSETGRVISRSHSHLPVHSSTTTKLQLAPWKIRGMFSYFKRRR